MTGSVTARPIEADDLSVVLLLNNEHATELSLLDAPRLATMVDIAALALALGPVGRPDAFLIAFAEDVPVQGPNHAWFLARGKRFVYVDRVCVGAWARRRGLARALYEAVSTHASRRGAQVLCCEVNSDPPNPGSDAFHESLGFHLVGSAYLTDRGKTVRYLERPLLSGGE
jgi:predicted GNAT superfamily acetyltransferase